MKRLYFMRHGLSVHNLIGVFSGRTDSPLTDEGRDEVRKNLDVIKTFDIDTIACSPLQRAIESAHIIADEINYPKNKIVINDVFSERDFGALENTPYEPLAIKDDVDDIESIDDFIKRAMKGLEVLNSLEADNILLVSHGSFGKALRSVISDEYPFKYPARFKNGEIVILI